MNEVIERIQQTGTVKGQSGTVHKVHSAVDRQEGLFLYNLIKSDPSVRRTLEVGCGFGLSSLHICAATDGREDAWHTIIDPFQKTQWDGAGLQNLCEAGFHLYDLIETKSEFALPTLAQTEEDEFDFVFVDGWHTFDHALIDCFYATRLLKVGGYLVIDDVAFTSVGRVVDLLKTWPCYEEYSAVSDHVPASWRKRTARLLMAPVALNTWKRVLAPRLQKQIFEKQSTRMVALRKIVPDERSWHWHDESF